MEPKTECKNFWRPPEPGAGVEAGERNPGRLQWRESGTVAGASSRDWAAAAPLIRPWLTEDAGCTPGVRAGTQDPTLPRPGATARPQDRTVAAGLLDPRVTGGTRDRGLWRARAASGSNPAGALGTKESSRPGHGGLRRGSHPRAQQQPPTPKLAPEGPARPPRAAGGFCDADTKGTRASPYLVPRGRGSLLGRGAPCSAAVRPTRPRCAAPTAAAARCPVPCARRRQPAPAPPQPARSRPLFTPRPPAR